MGLRDASTCHIVIDHAWVVRIIFVGSKRDELRTASKRTIRPEEVSSALEKAARLTQASAAPLQMQGITALWS